MPQPTAGPALPTPEQAMAAAAAEQEKRMLEEAKAQEELARQRTAAQVSALSSALMQKFGQLGRLHLERCVVS
eukprot:gene19205-29200_t